MAQAYAQSTNRVEVGGVSGRYAESTDAGAHPPLDDQGGDRDEGGISWVETDAGEGLEDGEAAEIDWDFDAGGASQEEDPSLVVPADPTSPDSDGEGTRRESCLEAQTARAPTAID